MVTRHRLDSFSLLLRYVTLFLVLLIAECRRIIKPLNDANEKPVEVEESDWNVTLDTDPTLLRRNLANTDFHEFGIKDYTQHKVDSLPGLKEKLNFNHYAGHIPVDALRNNNIFYWLIESSSDSSNKPLIIWLNGGPGCSSMDGLWLELGPFRIQEDRKGIKVNPFSWHHAANLLFIDQPVGTGFSFTRTKNGYPKNDEMINLHFYPFLVNFFRLHSRFLSPSLGKSYQTTRPIYFTGESHAGHFIPCIVQYILKQNDQLLSGNSNPEGSNVVMDIAGVALGNPWIDPSNQYNPAEFAHGLGLLSKGQVNRLKQQELKCRKLLSTGNYNSNLCITLLDQVIDSATIMGHHKLLMYDVRKFLSNPQVFPPGHEAMELYLNRKDVKTALHVLETPHRFQECTDPPFYALYHQDGKGSMNEIRFILERNINFLIFNGQYDLICNHLNIEKALDSFQWKGSKEWLNARPGIWSLNKRPVGYVRKAGPLQVLLVRDAGHMVPMDVPEIALVMIQSFIEKKELKTGDSKLGVLFERPLLGETNTPSTVGGEHRQLVGEEESSSKSSSSSPVSHAVSVFPTITMATPLQSGVYLRLRLHSSGRSAATSRQIPEMVNSTELFPYLLRIDPGARATRISPKWFLTTHHTADVIVEGLVPGIEYSFVIQYDGSSSTSSTSNSNSHSNSHTTTSSSSVHPNHHSHHAASHHHHSFGSRRVVVSKPGCFDARMSQCCEHGECVVPENDNGSPFCQCDAGYLGEQCHYYSVASLASGIHTDPLTKKRSYQVPKSNLTTVTASCPSRIFPPETSYSLHLSTFSAADLLPSSSSSSSNSNTASGSNAKPCASSGSMKCCLSVELVVKFSEEMLNLPIERLEGLISSDIKNCVNVIVGYKNLVVADVVIGSGPSSVTKLLKTRSHGKSSHSNSNSQSQIEGISYSRNMTISRQMPLILSMCGSPTLVNKVYRDLELLVKDPSSLVNQDVSWRLNQHYYRLISQKSFTSQEIAQIRSGTSLSALTHAADAVKRSSGSSSSSDSKKKHIRSELYSGMEPPAMIRKDSAHIVPDAIPTSSLETEETTNSNKHENIPIPPKKKSSKQPKSKIH